VPSGPSLDADLLGADCGVRFVCRTHQRIMMCLCVCTVKTVNGVEMNHPAISKYGTAGEGVTKVLRRCYEGALPALIRLHIHSRKLFLHFVCSVFMRFATHCYNY